MNAAHAAKKVLLVEDEFFIADMAAAMLEALGYEVVGPAGSVADGLRRLDAGRPDAALIDINLRGEMVYPLAVRLGEQSVPYAFVSGYASSGDMPPEFAKRPQLRKPYAQHELARTLERLLKA